MHLAADEIADRWRSALVRNARDIDAGHRFEKFGGEMVRGAGIAAGVIQVTGFGFRQCDKFAHRFRRQRRMHGQHRALHGEQTDRREIAKRVVGQLLVEMRIADVRGRMRHQRIAVRCRLGHGSGRLDRSPRDAAGRQSGESISRLVREQGELRFSGAGFTWHGGLTTCMMPT